MEDEVAMDESAAQMCFPTSKFRPHSLLLIDTCINFINRSLRGVMSIIESRGVRFRLHYNGDHLSAREEQLPFDATMGTPRSTTVIERVRRYHEKTKRQCQLYAQIIDKLEPSSFSDRQILYRPHDRAIHIMQIIGQLLP